MDVTNKLMRAPYNYSSLKAMLKSTALLGFMYNEAIKGVSEEQIVKDVLQRI